MKNQVILQITFSFVDVLRKSNNFSLRALENWGWKNYPTQQQENKVKGLAGEATVVGDLRTIPLFTYEKKGRKSSWAPYLAPATLNKTEINFSGDGDEDKTIDILYHVQAGTSFSDFSKFGITMPFVDTKGNVINKGKGETYEDRTTNFVIEVKTGNSTANFSKGFFQALRQTMELNTKSPMSQNVPVVALDRSAYLEALKSPGFKQAAENFIRSGGRILNIDSLNSRAENLRDDTRREIRNGENPNSSLPSQRNRSN